MKSNKLLWIVLPTASLLIIAIIVTAVLLVSTSGSENQYYTQMEEAQLYMEEMDYSKMIEAYEAAIELRPDDPDAYLALAEYYLEQEEYYDAISIAKDGFAQTGNFRLEKMLQTIELARMGQAEDEKVVQIDSVIVEGEDNPKLLIKNNVIGTIAEYCYQQYVNNYGEADVTYISEEAGYRVKFRGLSAYAYFRNSQEAGKVIDTVTKKPLPNVKPYKIEIQSPQLLFVGFEGYISKEKVGELFNILPESVIVQENNAYYLVFEYLDCRIRIGTDSVGNVYDSKPVIELYPLNLVSTWSEEDEQTADAEDDTTVKNNTFILGGQAYSYGITELIIYDKELEDLSPLADCKNLRTIVFYNCKIPDLSPLAGCSSLVELNMEESYGSMDLSCLANLSSLRYLGFHECKDIDDISCIYGLELYILHPCGSSVSIDQCIEYQNKHPDCEVWFDYFYPIRY